jgi:tetratricopeptide (TPR) repeat protein
MAATASIAQEFYKVRDEWARVDRLKSWRLAIWVLQFQDIDLVDKFMETERLPVGIFEDIFFRFDSQYNGDAAAFEQSLWKEYESWFEPPPEEKYDMLLALKNEGLLAAGFKPVINPEAGFGALMQELLRFKAAVKELDKAHFCLYFPPVRPEVSMLGGWLVKQLKAGIPNGIRLATIDFAINRKISIPDAPLTPLYVEIQPQLNTLEAIHNEMNKGGGSSNTVSVDERFRKQIRVVMNSTVKQDVALTSKEVQTLLSLSKKMGNTASAISGLLVAAQAHYSIKDNAQAELYADEAMVKSHAAMQQDDPAGYNTWKAATLLKGALLAGRKKWEEAIVLYDTLAAESTQRADAFFVMEGHRLSGHLHYQQNRLQKGFETLLLALVGGSYLPKDVIRQSTFLHAAYLAWFIGKKIKTPEEVEILEQQLQDWIGEDWKDLMEEGDMEQGTAKQKKGISVSLD